MAIVIDYVAVGNRIRKARKYKGVTQEDLAADLGLSIPYMSKIENGKAHLNLQRLLDIADVLELTGVDQLLGDNIVANTQTIDLDIIDILSDCDPNEKRVLVSMMRDNKENIRMMRASLDQD